MTDFIKAQPDRIERTAMNKLPQTHSKEQIRKERIHAAAFWAAALLFFGPVLGCFGYLLCQPGDPAASPPSQSQSSSSWD